MDQLTSLCKSTTTYGGRWLAHNRLPPVARAFVGADLVLGAQLSRPTISQAARLTRVSEGYVQLALHRQVDRALLERGVLPFVPVLSVVPATPLGPQERLAAIVNEIGLNATRDLLAGGDTIAA
jgi:hypothetical protein